MTLNDKTILLFLYIIDLVNYGVSVERTSTRSKLKPDRFLT